MNGDPRLNSNARKRFIDMSDRAKMLRSQRRFQILLQRRKPPGDLPEPPEDEHKDWTERVIG